jgi:hypothetical protein
VCWTLPDRGSSLVQVADFRPSLYAAACRRLLLFGAAKGQEKGNADRRARCLTDPRRPQRRINFR